MMVALRFSGGARAGRGDRLLTLFPSPQIARAPLHWAAQNGHLAVSRMLVEAGADLTAKNQASEGRVQRRVEDEREHISVKADRLCRFLK